MVDLKVPNEQIIFCALTGAHSFGWATGKSDIDLRVLYLPSPKEIIDPFHSLKIKQYMENPPYDITTIPFGHFCSLLVKGNANYLENVFMPKTIKNVDCVCIEVIVGRNLHKGYLHHYLGYYQSLKKDIGNTTRLKRYGFTKLALNSYRVLMTGLVLNEKHKVIFNLGDLDEIIPNTHAMNVLEDYLEGKETLASNSDVLKDLMYLEELLEEETRKSTLPNSKLLAEELLDFYTSKVFEIQNSL
jgi:predicted nucleotidyltransferase